MIALAEPDAYPLLLLKGRIAYRTAWAMRGAPRKRELHQRAHNWLGEYDEEHNFAHMGARFIDDENWGKPKTAKPKKLKTSGSQSQIAKFLQLARKTAMTPCQHVEAKS